MNSKLRSYVNAIRFYLNDYPETNALLGEQESGDGKIVLAIDKVLDDFNMSCPWNGSFSVDNFPSFSLLLDGAMIELLRSAGILQSRNNLNYSAGGLSVRIWDKAKDYMSWMSSFISSYERKKMDLIRRMNIKRAMGQSAFGLNSDYYLIGFSSSYIGGIF